MALKSWSIANFDGAGTEVYIEKTLLEADGVTIILLSLLISNYSETDDAHIIVTRTDSFDEVKFKWELDIPATNSPFALDSKMVFVDGDKLKIETNNANVAIDASGDES